MNLFFVLLFVFLFVAVLLAVLVMIDRWSDSVEWDRLVSLQPDSPGRFAPELVADLPEPARRYFGFVIQPGTPILPVVRINMNGYFSLGNKEDPRYQPMTANQILAAPEGFVWKMRTRKGMPISGSDSGRWTRFRILGLIPVARVGGDSDHTRSAFGRYVGEAIIWSPAALLPGPSVKWTAAGENSARVTVQYGDLEQAVDVTVDQDGRPVEVVLQRWSDANADKVHRLQPFGAVMSDFRDVEGYRLPFHVEAGNLFGTDEYFPFFRAQVQSIGFPEGASG
jgi:hypothetical protein